MSARSKLKIWKYALAYFLEANEVGIIKTSQILDGFKSSIQVGKHVLCKWENEVYITRILELAG